MTTEAPGVADRAHRARPGTTGAVRIAVVDDHPLYLSAVVAAFEGAPEIQVVLQCHSWEELDSHLAVDPSVVDVVLLDLTLPGRGGADAVAAVTERGPAVLVLSGTAPRTQIVEVLAAGALGYLTKTARAEDIITATRTVARGEGYLARDVAGLLGEAMRVRRHPGVEITAREREVLALVARGMTDRMIAQHLTISLATVRSHLDRIRTKTGSRRRADLTRLAVEAGLGPGPAAPGGSGDRDRTG